MFCFYLGTSLAALRGRTKFSFSRWSRRFNSGRFRWRFWWKRLLFTRHKTISWWVYAINLSVFLVIVLLRLSLTRRQSLICRFELFLLYFLEFNLMLIILIRSVVFHWRLNYGRFNWIKRVILIIIITLISYDIFNWLLFRTWSDRGLNTLSS